jgi:hypothetical protein
MTRTYKEEIKMKNCEWYVSDIRWTDKLSVTYNGDIIDFNGQIVEYINLEKDND